MKVSVGGPVENENVYGTLSIDVYDRATNATRDPLVTSYGPRWGMLKEGRRFSSCRA